MAQQDKTDWYWNGELAGAVNNLYYDFINVDVCHVPYATQNRNSSFFLKTRLAYQIDKTWSEWTDTDWYEVTDVKIIWDDDCDEERWIVYAIGKKVKEKAIFAAPIVDWCVWHFFNCSENCTPRSGDPDEDYYDECPDMKNVKWCWDWKLFVTDYVKWNRQDWTQILQPTWDEPLVNPWVYTWIQINKYNLWTTLWYFSDEYIETWEGEFTESFIENCRWKYLLVYASSNDTDEEWNPTPAWFAWQVRLITWSDAVDGKTRLTVDSPWLWFRVPNEDDIEQNGSVVKKWWHVSYAIFSDWWQVAGFTDSNKIYLMTNPDDCRATRLYVQDSETETNIISVTDCNDKIFILTDNWYVHYSKEWIGYNKFFIDDDMFAWADKTSILWYRDMLLAFGRRHIALWVPDEQNRFWTMYNQSTTIGTWSRYSYAEYDWDIVFVSNDKRLLILEIASTWRYWLNLNDVWSSMRINWKLSMLVPWDEVYVWSEDNNLKIFVNTKPIPYIQSPRYAYNADINTSDWNTMTHIYKFDTLFRVWTEDHISGILIKWAIEWIFFWEDGIYSRINWSIDEWGWDIIAKINAYLIENESDWTWVNNSWLSQRPKLHNLAKLNRLITVLWPGEYSNNSKIKITTYSKWIGYTYEFPISWDWNDWLWLMTTYYKKESLDYDEREKIECMLSTLQDSQKQYQPNCPDWEVYRQYVRQERPWCGSYTEMLTESHWVCINDKLYELAPTMPLVTDLWENQNYATQIKLELIWWKGDKICFGWWLAELFIAPLFTKGPDWEYQLQPNTDCE